MIDEGLVERARVHVRRWFARRMPRHMEFHDLDHTLNVAAAAVSIGQAMKLPLQELLRLEVAALFHDTGYAMAYHGHERHSADLAEAFLQDQGTSRTDIARVRALIMSTRAGATPKSLAQQVIRDADSSKAGQVDFAERSERLRRELEAVTGQRISDREWLRGNIAYLAAHRFHTSHARKRYGSQKRINLADLRARLGLPKRILRRTKPPKERFMHRDLSWLSFNARVLQEAKDPRNPLLERVRFLAIYSNNLDEFYRVRVASLRGLAKMGPVKRQASGIPHTELLQRINAKALEQQQEFGAYYRGTLLPELAANGIRFLRPGELSPPQLAFVHRFFAERVAPLLHTSAVRPGNAPFIEDRKLYFVCRLRGKGSGKGKGKGKNKERLVLVNIPSDELGRFLRLPAKGNRTDLMFLDDAMRACLGTFFKGHKVLGVHAIKLSRDAELYLHEEFVESVKDKVRKSLRKRTTGVPSRFLYDDAMPGSTLRALRELLALSKQDTVAGGRYHNFSDLMKLPVEGHARLHFRPWPPVEHRATPMGSDTFGAVAKGDVLWHFPYHDFGMFVDWLRQAAADPAVRHIAITLYRVAEGSAVCAALLDALRNGKRVTAFVEVQARFDERSNLFWGEELEKAGATVLYSYENIKVHCKLCLIERREGGRLRRYAYLGTGNFNERTARIYTDTALLTAREPLTREVAAVFRHLSDRRNRPVFRHLMMAPLGLRSGIEALIDKEIENALKGRQASILLKLNSLEDTGMVRKLYHASNAGVRVRVIVRGICCLVTEVPGLSDRIEAISIVDRYLEHARVFVFGNAGDPLVYLSSADLMERNLDRRVEVAFPVLDPQLKQEVLHLLELQWNDRVKARVIDAEQGNPYRPAPTKGRAVHAQAEIRKYIIGKERA